MDIHVEFDPADNHKEVWDADQKIGHLENDLLVLLPEVSKREWEQVKEHIAGTQQTSGKINRQQVSGLYHSYEIIDGTPYRVSHSMGAQGLDYHERGYLGQGAFGNVKKIVNERGDEFAMKVEGLTEEQYNEQKSKPASKEAKITREVGDLKTEYLRTTESNKEWREGWDEEGKKLFAKKVTILSLAKGENALDIVQAHLSGERELSNADKYHITLPILYALSNIHEQNILHRDVKLENIIVDLKNKQAKLIDFGLSEYLPSGITEIVQGRGFGSPIYMAPEVIQVAAGTEAIYSKSSDIYALGLVLLDMYSDTDSKDNYLLSNEFIYIHENMLCGEEAADKALNFYFPDEDEIKRQESLTEDEYEIESNSIKDQLKIAVEERNNRKPTNEIIHFFTQRLVEHNQPVIEKLTKQLNNVQDDEKAALLDNLAQCYHFIDYKKGGEYYELAMESSTSNVHKQEYFIKRIDFFERDANLALMQGQYDKAAEIMNEASKFIDKNNQFDFALIGKLKDQVTENLTEIGYRNLIHQGNELLIPVTDKRVTAQRNQEAAQKFMHAAELTNATMLKLSLYEKAILLLPEKGQAHCALRIVEYLNELIVESPESAELFKKEAERYQAIYIPEPPLKQDKCAAVVGFSYQKLKSQDENDKVSNKNQDAEPDKPKPKPKRSKHK